MTYSEREHEFTFPKNQPLKSASVADIKTNNIQISSTPSGRSFRGGGSTDQVMSLHQGSTKRRFKTINKGLSSTVLESKFHIASAKR